MSHSHSGSRPVFWGQVPLKRNVLYASPDDGHTLVPSMKLMVDVNQIQDQNLSPEMIGELEPEFVRTPFSNRQAQESISSGLFFAVPDEMIQTIQDSSRREPFSAKDLQRLRTVSRSLCGSCFIGYFNNNAIMYEHLHGRVPLQGGKLLQEQVQYALEASDPSGRENVQSIVNALVESDKRRLREQEIERAYCGWLVTNPMYVEEQFTLCNEFRERIDNEGFPTAVQLRRIPREERTPFHVQCGKHYNRWMLDGIAGMDLPVPVSFQYVEDQQRFDLDDEPVRFRPYLPEYYSFRGDGFVAEIYSSNRPKRQYPHLSEWFEITERDNPEMNKMQGYIRRLKIVIYSRGLSLACSEESHVTTGAMKAGLAKCLKVSEDTIKIDLKVIEKVMKLYEKMPR